MQLMQARKTLRDLLKTETCLAVPGCHDAFTARILEHMGFKAIYLTGYGIEASRLGRPDIGLASMAEVIDHAKNVAASVTVPVVCDSDTGYGGVLNVIRTVKEFERAGVAGIHIEDQVIPKKCGGLPGRGLVSIDEMVGKIKAAKDALDDKDFVIIARTDSKATFGLDEARRRLHAYLDAGADLVMISERYSLTELRELAADVRGKLLMCGGIPGWEETNLSINEYGEMGVKVVIYPLTGLYAAGRAVQRIYQLLRDRGQITEQELNAACLSFDEANEILQLNKWLAWEAKYSPA